MVEKPILSQKLPVFRGELALAIAVVINSFGVVLMLYSGSGISAISSVPFAFSEVFSNNSPSRIFFTITQSNATIMIKFMVFDSANVFNIEIISCIFYYSYCLI